MEIFYKGKYLKLYFITLKEETQYEKNESSSKRMRAAVNVNDRIVIDSIDRKVIQYILVEAKTGKETWLRNPIDFLLSVKKYFGSNGKTIRELYNFKSWHNRKLETEMKRIWSVVDKQCCMKIDKVREQEVLKHVSYDDERAA